MQPDLKGLKMAGVRLFRAIKTDGMKQACELVKFNRTKTFILNFFYACFICMIVCNDFAVDVFDESLLRVPLYQLPVCPTCNGRRNSHLKRGRLTMHDCFRFPPKLVFLDRLLHSVHPKQRFGCHWHFLLKPSVRLTF